MKRLLCASTAIVFFVTFGCMCIYAHMAPTPLKAQIGKHRPLLIFTPSADDARAIEQMKLLPRLPDQLFQFRERDIVLYDLPFEMPHDGSLSPEDANAARTRFHVAPRDFTVILLGKDGGEKLRSTTPVTVDRLNQLIDSMPMRKQEMKEAKRN